MDCQSNYKYVLCTTVAHRSFKLNIDRNNRYKVLQMLKLNLEKKILDKLLF